MESLQGKKVAILVTDGFEQVELTEPKKALDQAGAKTEIVSPTQDQVKGWKHTEWGDKFPVDTPLQNARPDDYDALLLPGGVMNPDHLRRDPAVQRFVKSFFDNGKPVAAICHGPWTLIDAGVARGKKMTSYETIQMDLKNAGVEWVDQEVVIDGNLVTSRKPDDLPAFNKAIVELFAREEVGAAK
ncbi:MAG TPA: type 1 glutamine amidotransferase domain-containing protein [Thermoanaerobaculia bacterium]|nr:type 1 glutamine amidotransferase domain-containing protein [Thermoanaerobaculia bacterium]